MNEQERLAFDGIDFCRRLVMQLYGGNLDHPALDELDNAMRLVAVQSELRKDFPRG